MDLKIMNDQSRQQTYGAFPEDVVRRYFLGLSYCDLDDSEYPLEMLRYLYLPIKLKDGIRFAIPKNLEPYRRIIDLSLEAFQCRTNKFSNLLSSYVYVTVKRSYVSDTAQNRPGWHCDGFGTDDVNYIWCDSSPARVLVGDLSSYAVPDDHVKSMEVFERMALDGVEQKELSPKVLYEMTPWVIHAPSAPKKPGIRTFVKVSISPHEYNLIGNSHNYELDYRWEMYPRDQMRNDPHRAQLDHYSTG